MARLHVRHLVRSDGFAGVERYLTYVGPELVRRGHTVSVVGGAPDEMRRALTDTGVTFIPARSVVEVVRGAATSPAPDLLHAHMTAAELAAVLVAPRLGCPAIATLHFGGGRGHSTTTRTAYRAIGARLDAELAVSRFVADEVGGGVRVLAPGIPEPGPGSTISARSTASGIVLVAQRLEPEKDTEVAIEAWARAGLGDRGWELRLAGLGSQDSALRALARQVDPTGSIHFLGHLPDLAAELRGASILLAPTPREAFGLTVVEAMACGVPVVAAAGGGHLETVGPVRRDLLFPPGDVAAASACLLRLADAPEMQTEVGRALRVRFEAEYRIERHAERLEAVYRDLLDGRRRRRPARPAPAARTAGARRSVALVFPGCHREGGVERVVRELARRLATTHDVTFVGDRFDPDGMDGVDFVPVGGRRPPGVPGPVSFRRAAGRVLAREGFEVTVGFGVECPPGDIAVVGSVHRAWLGQSGPVGTPFGDVPARARFAMPRHVALLALERSYFASSRTSAVLATSPMTAAELTRLYPVSPDRVEVMPNGFDATEFHPGVRAAHRTALRTSLGVSDDIVVLFVANELHRKGFGTLLEAVALVGDRRLRVEMVGRASPAAYRRRIAELGLRERVRWNGPQPDVARWYAMGDLLVLPTRYEPFGNVIVESLACGLPVITTSVAGAAAAVVPGVSGLVQVDPTDATELADLLRAALQGDHLTRWSRDSRAGLAPFEWSIVADQLRHAVDVVSMATS